ncbi:MAG: hypothetical protein ACYCOY_10985 [Metallibacterium sp.]
MLAKKTVKNQITLPKAVVGRFAGVDYFEVSTDGTAIVLAWVSARLNRTSLHESRGGSNNSIRS